MVKGDVTTQYSSHLKPTHFAKPPSVSGSLVDESVLSPPKGYLISQSSAKSNTSLPELREPLPNVNPQVITKTLKQFGLNSVQIWGPDALWWLLALKPGEWSRIMIPSKTYQLYASWFGPLWNLSPSDIPVQVGLHLGMMTKSNVIPSLDT